MADPKSIVILGAGPFALEVADLLRDVGPGRVATFVEGLDPERAGARLGGRPILWIDELSEHAGGAFLCAVGSTRRGQLIAAAERHGLFPTRLVHPRAHVSDTVRLGPGTIVFPGAVVGTSTRIDEHAVLNRGVLVGHHCRIGARCTIGPGANIAGRTRLGAECFIGMGATIADGIEIGAGAVIGAGSLVLSSIPAGVRAWGTPATVVDAPSGAPDG